MVFKTGQSGNPNGRRKGSLNKRSQLARLLEPHAEKLVQKMIDLALNGDAIALRLCIERLIPKIQREPACIDLPNNLSPKNIARFKNDILQAAIDGRISLDDAERFKKLLLDQTSTAIPLSINTTDPIEASKIYQEIMRSN